jgi:hypothetical protein
MILKASQRAGAKQLALHLLRTDENDHVEVHEVRGFAAVDLVGALREAYAISRGTKCRQYLFSLSLSPPPTENVEIPVFEQAIQTIEDQLGLTGQPRVIIFHEKYGRRHAHCVWSRIRASDMRAINLPYFKTKLKDIARDLFIEHGWNMPRGFVASEERDPLNFTRDEWQQARRINRDPKAVKKLFQDCWAISDSGKAFRRALEVRGYYLAQGDRRGFVAVDYLGEIYSISRWTSVRTKDVAARLGDPSSLPDVETVKARLHEQIDAKLARFRMEARAEFDTARSGLLRSKRKLVTWQRDERKFLVDLQAARWATEAQSRQQRMRKGLKGLWDWITGKRGAIIAQNEREYKAARLRDQSERQTLIERQIAERQTLHRQIKEHEHRLDSALADLQVSAPRHTEAQDLQPAQEQRNRQRRGRRYAPRPEF